MSVEKLLEEMYGELTELGISKEDSRYIWIEATIADEKTRINRILKKNIEKPYEEFLEKVLKRDHLGEYITEESYVQEPYIKTGVKLIEIYDEINEQDKKKEIVDELVNILSKNIADEKYESLLKNIELIPPKTLEGANEFFLKRLSSVNNEFLVDNKDIPNKSYMRHMIHHGKKDKFNSLLDLLDENIRTVDDSGIALDCINQYAKLAKENGDLDKAEKILKWQRFPLDKRFFEYTSIISEIVEGYDYKKKIEHFLDYSFSEDISWTLHLLEILVKTEREEHLFRNKDIFILPENWNIQQEDKKEIHAELVVKYAKDALKADGNKSNQMKNYKSILTSIHKIHKDYERNEIFEILNEVKNKLFNYYSLGSSIDREDLFIFPSLAGCYLKIGRSEDVEFILSYMQSLRIKEGTLSNKIGVFDQPIYDALEVAYLNDFFVGDPELSIRSYQTAINFIKGQTRVKSLKNLWFRPEDHKRLDYLNLGRDVEIRQFGLKGKHNESIELLKETLDEQKTLEKKNPDYINKEFLEKEADIIKKLIDAYRKQTRVLTDNNRFNNAVRNLFEIRDVIKKYEMHDSDSIYGYRRSIKTIEALIRRAPKHANEIINFNENLNAGETVFIKKLGQGVSGKTYQAHSFSIGKDIAIKVIDNLKNPNEAKFLASLNHENIVRIYYADKSHVTYNGFNVYSIIMDFIDGETIGDKILKGLGTEETISYSYQLLKGIQYLDLQYIFHRDINLNNVMIDKNNILKIVDFGLAGRTTDEPMDNRRYGGSTDLYSWGLLTYKMLTGEHLFNEGNYKQIEYPEMISQIKRDSLNADGKLKKKYLDKVMKLPELFSDCILIGLQEEVDTRSNIERVLLNYETRARISQYLH